MKFECKSRNIETGNRNKFKIAVESTFVVVFTFTLILTLQVSIEHNTINKTSPAIVEIPISALSIAFEESSATQYSIEDETIELY